MALAYVARCPRCTAVVAASVFDHTDAKGWAMDALSFLAKGYAVTTEHIDSFQQEECGCAPTDPKPAGPRIRWNDAA